MAFDALYFGYIRRGGGHFLRRQDMSTVYDPSEVPTFPRAWTGALLDTGFLRNGKHPDVIDGKVFWTLAGGPIWYAFFWWDSSGDQRSNSNSGFYVSGFDYEQEQAAFDYARLRFPTIVARQRVPLALADYPARARA